MGSSVIVLGDPGPQGNRPWGNVELREVMECSCSICSKTGSRSTFVAPGEFRLLTGGDNLDGRSL